MSQDGSSEQEVVGGRETERGRESFHLLLPTVKDPNHPCGGGRSLEGMLLSSQEHKSSAESMREV